MPKLLIKTLVVAIIFSALAISWHMAEMGSGMMNDGDMSPACLTVCFTHGDISAPVVALSFVVACIALLIFW
jgi:hypothetical protein